MLEESLSAWQHYAVQLFEGLPADDSRRYIDGEIQLRLRQINYILGSVTAEVEALPHHHRSANTGDATGLLRNREAIRLFTEAFYLSARRLVDLLNLADPAWPYIDEIKSATVSRVSDALTKPPGPDIRPSSVMITTYGPVLGEPAMTVKAATGATVGGDHDGMDGLFAVAEALDREIVAKLNAAASALT